MKEEAFYRVLVPLLNTILTGNIKLAFSSDKIRLTTDFIQSLPDQKASGFNRHFSKCIQTYLDTLPQDNYQDLGSVFIDNRSLLSMAVLIRDLDCPTPLSEREYHLETTLILLDFLSQKKIDPILNLTLYLYLENLYLIEIIDQSISVLTYTKMIRDHSRVRTKEELFRY